MSNENPYDKITFDPSSYRKAQREVSDSFSQSISDAGTTAGMAAGMTGRSAGRVVANVAGRAYSARDEAASRITAQEAAAKTQFEQWKAVKKAEFESQKPGIFDILGTVLETGAAVATTALTAGACCSDSSSDTYYKRSF